MMRMIRPVWAAGIVALMASPAGAIEIWMDRGNAHSTIIVAGPIERGDAEKLKAYWEERLRLVWLHDRVQQPGR